MKIKKKFAKSRQNLNNMENKFYWDPDTLEYYKNAEWREIWNYVKNECHLEDGETYEMLANDLMNQTRK